MMQVTAEGLQADPEYLRIHTLRKASNSQQHSRTLPHCYMSSGLLLSSVVDTMFLRKSARAMPLPRFSPPLYCIGAWKLKERSRPFAYNWPDRWFRPVAASIGFSVASPTSEKCGRDVSSALFYVLLDPSQQLGPYWDRELGMQEYCDFWLCRSAHRRWHIRILCGRATICALGASHRQIKEHVCPSSLRSPAACCCRLLHPF